MRAYLPVVGCCFVLGLLCASAWAHIKTDDSFVFLKYASNLIHGNGFVFNKGERVNGSTSIVMPLLIAAFAYIPVLVGGLDLWFVSRCLDALALAGGFFSLFLISRKISFGVQTDLATHGMGQKNIFWILAVLIMMAHERFRAGTGMESFVVIAVQLSSVAAYVYQRHTLCSFFVGLAPLTRPDAICIPGVLYLYDAFTGRSLFRPWRVVIAIAPLVAWLIFSHEYFGQFLPETISAKLAQTASGRWGDGLIFLGGFRTWRDGFGSLSFVVYGLMCLVVAIQYRAWLTPGPLLIVYTGYLLYLGMYIFVVNPPPYQWYYVPAVVLLSLVTAQSICCSRRFIRIAALILFGGLCIRAFAHDYQERQTAKYVIYRAAAEYLNQAYPPDTSVAASEIGVVGFFYHNGPTIDLLGLVSKGSPEHIKRGEFDWAIHHYKPDVLLLANPPRGTLEGYTRQSWFAEQYKRVKTAWVTSEGSILDSRPREKMGGFTLFERVDYRRGS